MSIAGGEGEQSAGKKHGTQSGANRSDQSAQSDNRRSAGGAGHRPTPTDTPGEPSNDPVATMFLAGGCVSMT